MEHAKRRWYYNEGVYFLDSKYGRYKIKNELGKRKTWRAWLDGRRTTFDGSLDQVQTFVENFLDRMEQRR